MAQNQASIHAMIEAGENLLGVVAYSKLSTSYVLVITDRRLLNLKKGKLEGRLNREDVGRTRIFNLPRSNGRYLVAIQTHEGMLYADDDPARLEPGRWMSVISDDPKVPQRVSAIIDQFYGLT
ncbi:MAG: hypothetical protein QOJ29_2249 [Thermoleophilaceae bacterium]|nr:hypothetical protein [Thermoleophilaceae bacterium]